MNRAELLGLARDLLTIPTAPYHEQGVQRFVTAYCRGLGLAPPRVRIRVWGDPASEGEEGPISLAEVHLGQVDPDQGIVARTPARSVVYRIAHDLAEHLPVSAEAFRNRFVSEEVEETSAEADASADQTTDPGLEGEESP